MFAKSKMVEDLRSKHNRDRFYLTRTFHCHLQGAVNVVIMTVDHWYLMKNSALTESFFEVRFS